MATLSAGTVGPQDAEPPIEASQNHPKIHHWLCRETNTAQSFSLVRFEQNTPYADHQHGQKTTVDMYHKSFEADCNQYTIELEDHGYKPKSAQFNRH